MHDVQSGLPAPNGPAVDHTPPDHTPPEPFAVLPVSGPALRPMLPNRPSAPALALIPALQPTAPPTWTRFPATPAGPTLATSPTRAGALAVAERTPDAPGPRRAPASAPQLVSPPDPPRLRLLVPAACMVTSRIVFVMLVAALASRLRLVGNQLADNDYGQVSMTMADVRSVLLATWLMAILAVVSAAWWSARVAGANSALGGAAAGTIGNGALRWAGYPALVAIAVAAREFGVFKGNLESLRPAVTLALVAAVSFVAINTSARVMHRLGRARLIPWTWCALEVGAMYVLVDTWNRSAPSPDSDTPQTFIAVASDTSVASGWLIVGVLPMILTAWSVHRLLARRRLEITHPDAVGVPTMFGVVRPELRAPQQRHRRRIPEQPFVVLMIIGHVGWGALALMSGVSTFIFRSALGDGARRAELLRLADRADTVSVAALGAAVVMFISHGLWCTVVVVNAARSCTEAPLIRVPVLMFGVPVLLATAGIGALSDPGNADVGLFAIALIAGLPALIMSFRLVGRCAMIVGAETTVFRNWSFVLCSMFVLSYVMGLFAGSDLIAEALLVESSVSVVVGSLVLVGVVIGGPGAVRLASAGRAFHASSNLHRPATDPTTERGSAAPLSMPS